MIDHIAIRVSDYQRSKDLYTSVLQHVGYRLHSEAGPYARFGFAPSTGEKGKVSFILSQAERPSSLHFCFAAKSRDAVRAFYDAALTAGATGYEAPGIREQLHPQYFAASFFDPDGNNVEAVFIGA
jgi:catechol 2,3-dioxygenase-like lactoylglutathione lyase family enzyme